MTRRDCRGWPLATSRSCRGGSNFLLRRQKKVTKEEATPEIRREPCGARNRRAPHKSPDGALTARWWAHGAALGLPVAARLGANQWGPCPPIATAYAGCTIVKNLNMQPTPERTNRLATAHSNLLASLRYLNEPVSLCLPREVVLIGQVEAVLGEHALIQEIHRLSDIGDTEHPRPAFWKLLSKSALAVGYDAESQALHQRFVEAVRGYKPS